MAARQQEGTSIAVYAGIASSADNTNMHDAAAMTDVAESSMSHGEFHRTCCNVMCMDRNEYAHEVGGYRVRLCTMPGLETSAKTDLLIGWSATGERV